MLYDAKDPTIALFISERSASRVANWLSNNHKNVRRCVVKMRKRAGENLGYQVIAHHKDPRLTAPITNSDLERIEGKMQ